MPDIRLIRNDSNFNLTFYILDSDGNTLDLTSATAVFTAQDVRTNVLLFNAVPCLITQPTLGQVLVPVSTQLANYFGELIGQIRITFGTAGSFPNATITAPDISIKVIKDIPK
jgi:hypothetical protein